MLQSRWYQSARCVARIGWIGHVSLANCRCYTFAKQIGWIQRLWWQRQQPIYASWPSCIFVTVPSPWKTFCHCWRTSQAKSQSSGIELRTKRIDGGRDGCEKNHHLFDWNKSCAYTAPMEGIEFGSNRNSSLCVVDAITDIRSKLLNTIQNRYLVIMSGKKISEKINLTICTAKKGKENKIKLRQKKNN